MEYLSTGQGSLADCSRALVAAARGDRSLDSVVRNGRLVNVHTGEILDREVGIAEGRVARVAPHGELDADREIDADGRYLAPGFLDAHVHVESAMVTARGFARGVVPTGTTGAFYDPHELANVLGLDGVRLLVEEARATPLRALCTVPSCVPAAPGFEDAGAEIGVDGIREALEWDGVVALGEMMDYPGVIAGDETVHGKLAATYDAGRVATGHYAARDVGAGLDAFAAAGVSSCHESVRREEALAKLRAGLWTMLREGSAWSDVPETVTAVTETGVDTRHLLLVTDDAGPETITGEGHLDRVLRVAISNGLDPVTAIQAVTINAAEYYGVHDVGALSPGRLADAVFLDDLASVDVSAVMIGGELVAEGGEWVSDPPAPADHVAAVHEAYPEWARDTVSLSPPTPERFAVEAPDGTDTVTAETVRVHGGETATTRETTTLPVRDGVVVPEGVSTAAVFERHGGDGSVGRGFVAGFGFERGAVASTVAHDSHNLVVVGQDAESMATAARRVIELDGGMVAADGDRTLASVALPVGGLLSDRPLGEVADAVADLEAAWRELGADIDAPLLTLSLLALPVIPELRLTNRGLVDVTAREFVAPVRPA